MKSLIQIPILSDNYAYLAINGKSQAFVVDPGKAEPVLDYLANHPSIKLEAILCTHHHFDHVGGNKKIQERTGCKIIGPQKEADKIANLSQLVTSNQLLKVAKFNVHLIDVHAHTAGHVAYLTDDLFQQVIKHGHDGRPEEATKLNNKPAIFVGDALFGAGCGRLFEGNANDLFIAMEKLAVQPANYLIACAHEYTKANLVFAQKMLPKHIPILDRLSSFKADMGASMSSIPSTLETELETNPYLLALREPFTTQLAKKFGISINSKQDVLKALRKVKDNDN